MNYVLILSLFGIFRHKAKTNVYQRALGFCTWGAQGAAAFLNRSGGSVVTCRAPDIPPASIVEYVFPTSVHVRPSGFCKLTNSTVGAGDTFVAGVLYQLVTNKAIQEPNGEWTANEDTMREVLAFAVDLATRKVQIDGFQGLV